MATSVSTGMLTKGITLSYKNEAEYVVLEDLQEMPELGGSRETIEVTTLKDGAIRRINGLKDFGELEFGFLFGSGAGSSFNILSGLESAGEVTDFEVTLPDGTTAEFPAFVSVKIDSAGVNAAMTFKANLALNGEMVITPAA